MENRRIPVLIIVLFMNLIIMSSSIVLNNNQSLLSYLVSAGVSPFQTGFQKSFDFVSHKLRHYVFVKNKYRDFYELKKKYSDLKYQNYLLRRYLKQAEFYEKAKGKFRDFITVEVISVDPHFPYNNITINAGSDKGLKSEMVVVNIDGQLVGRITEPVSDFSSKVRLITSSLGGAGAYVKKNLLEGLIVGRNTKLCEFKYLIDNSPIKIGDEVISSGTDMIYPPYLPIGRIVDIEKEALMQKVIVRPYFLEKSIKQLVVLKDEG